MKLRILAMLALSVIFLAVQSLSAQEGDVAQSGPGQSSSKRVPSPTTRVSEGQVSLAPYFNELASQERDLADTFSRLAAIYRVKTPPRGTGDATAREMAVQYRRMAEAAKKAAEAAASVAAYHGRVARQAGYTPVPNSPRHPTQTFSTMGK